MPRNLFRNRLLHSRINGFSTTGFTLIEVVVAMAILGVALTVIIELFSGGLRLGRTSVEYTRAVNYARMKMEEIAVKPLTDEGNEEGKFDETYRWQVAVKRVDLLPEEKGAALKPPVQLFQIKINVLWKSGIKERSTALETYRTIKPEEYEEEELNFFTFLLAKSRGFTLIEVVITLTVLSLILLIILGAFRLGLSAWEKGESTKEEYQKVRIISQLISQQIKSIVPYKIKTQKAEGDYLAFEGKVRSLRFVSAFPIKGKQPEGFVYAIYEFKEGGREGGRLVLYEQRALTRNFFEEEPKEEVGPFPCWREFQMSASNIIGRKIP